MISLKPKSFFPYLMRDILTFSFAFLISLYFFRDAQISKYEWVILFGLMFMIFLIEFWRRPDQLNLDHEFKQRFIRHLKAYCIFIGLVILCYWLIPIKWHHKGSVITIITGVSVMDFIMNFMLVKVTSSGKYSEAGFKHILIAGTGPTAKNVERQLLQERSKLKIRGFISCHDDEQCQIGGDRILGDLKNINQYLYANTVDEIVIALPTIYSREIQEVLSVADYHGVRAKYILDYQEIFGSNYKITRLGQIDAVDIRKLPADGMIATFSKNCFDKVFAAIALILLAPLMLFVAILIKLDSPGPLFYYPIRIGRGGKPFKLFKFRTMRENDNVSGGTLSTQQNDPRITRVGHFLRKYSLDELPQFVNVFLGSMSVVGPRPHRRYLNRQLQDSVTKYMVRQYVKPGITGWAQVNGWRGPTETEEQRRQRTIHDLWYIENWSIWLDFKIVYLTIFSKKTRKGAF